MLVAVPANVLAETVAAMMGARFPQRRVDTEVQDIAPPCLVPFPPHRDTKLVAKLITAYLRLVGRHGNGAYAAFQRTQESRIVTRLMALGVSQEEAQAEVLRVHQAMASMSLHQQAERTAAWRMGGRSA